MKTFIFSVMAVICLASCSYFKTEEKSVEHIVYDSTLIDSSHCIDSMEMDACGSDSLH